MMKYLVYPTILLLMISCGDNSSKKESVSSAVHFGEVKVDSTKAVSVDEMLTCFEGNGDKVDFTFKAEIKEVCTKAGCWISVDKGNGETFMVRFKNHFTIPVKTKLNTKAIIHGFAHMDTVSVKSLQHFAEDAGESKEEIAKITEPKYEMGFQADGILLLNK